MRYQTFDFLSRSAGLMHDSLQLLHDVANHPANPFAQTWPARFFNASVETGMRLTRRYEKPEFGINEIMINEQPITVREEVVHEKPFCNLMHFNRIGVNDTHKVLLVAPLSGHHATLLKGTVEALLPDHEVYITDWLDARDVPRGVGKFTFDRYVSYLVDFMKFLGSDTHMIAICQPTVQALIATAVLAQEQSDCIPKSLTLMAGPIDTSKNPTRVNEYSHQHPMSWFKNFAIMKVPEGYPGAGREVYPGFLQLGGFISMNQKMHTDKFVNFYQNLLFGEQEDAERYRAFYDEYLAVLDMPAEFYLETIERVFKNNELANGTMTYQGEKVDFGAIKNVPLLTVEGANDDIVGIGQTEAAHSICKNIPKKLRRHHLQEGAGHYGIFSGSKFRDHVRPLISEFIHKYN
ncbi:polyhydroxyalkanoate depolymerase [Paraneptunicella aestuarii]|uniref:polyhydroxyalkanoate depolymerase n=1 Tax=Paraneptunicella aestuarii TaxID=2831148 RepID=UPI001E58A8AD|nr:polyhydroxyalkanoate depolymerase [Paraneptunicella aestuarii]UAA37329.1 polyhydroxyalkanoate depolymerase [Paraneptunicella aestuarii]